MKYVAMFLMLLSVSVFTFGCAEEKKAADTPAVDAPADTPADDAPADDTPAIDAPAGDEMAPPPAEPTEPAVE